MPRPSLIVFANQALFNSFFWGDRSLRLKKLFVVKQLEARELTAAMRRDMADADAFVTTWDSPNFGADLVRLAPRLRMIAHCGGEVKKRFDASLFRKLTITNAPEPFARPVAEFAAALLLYTTRNIDAYRAASQKSPVTTSAILHATGRLPNTFGTVETLIGQEVSMIGLGRIGRALMDLLKGFEIRWLVHDPYASQEMTGEHNVQLLPLSAVLKRGARLVLAAAATEKTHHLMNARRLAMLPDGAIVINVARGSLVDLEALTREVRSGRLRCALDVTDPEEPLPGNHPLRKLPGVILTPHVAGGGLETRRQIADIVLDDLERFFQGKPVHNRVTTAMLKRMT